MLALSDAFQLSFGGTVNVITSLEFLDFWKYREAAISVLKLS